VSPDCEHLVIGAGIGGLGAAHFSARLGLDTLVLDAAGRLGGCIATHAFPGLDGFWTEAGSHTCFNSYGNLLAIMDELGLTPRAEAKGKVSYRLWQGGRRRPILSALHPLEAALALPRLFRAPKAGRSVADYYGEVLGRRNYRDLLRHAFQAVICQDADEYPAEALFRRKPRRKEMVRAFTFAEGLAAIPAAIAAQAGVRVRTGAEVVSVESADPGFRVRLADGSELAAPRLTLAVPPDAAARLIPAPFAEARAAAAGIGMAEIETLVLAFRGSDLDLPPLAGLIAVDDAFYSAVSRDFRPDPGHRGFAFHFRPGALGPEAQIERACAALGVDPARVAAQARYAHRLPALRTGHAGLALGLDRAIAGSQLAVVGNWFLGVSIEDTLTRARSESLRLFGR
jgi:protoporphyrinogen oxidase